MLRAQASLESESTPLEPGALLPLEMENSADGVSFSSSCDSATTSAVCSSKNAEAPSVYVDVCDGNALSDILRFLLDDNFCDGTTSSFRDKDDPFVSGTISDKNEAFSSSDLEEFFCYSAAGGSPELEMESDDAVFDLDGIDLDFDGCEGIPSV